MEINEQDHCRVEHSWNSKTGLHQGKSSTDPHRWISTRFVRNIKHYVSHTSPSTRKSLFAKVGSREIEKRIDRFSPPRFRKVLPKSTARFNELTPAVFWAEADLSDFTWQATLLIKHFKLRLFREKAHQRRKVGEEAGILDALKPASSPCWPDPLDRTVKRGSLLLTCLWHSYQVDRALQDRMNLERVK